MRSRRNLSGLVPAYAQHPGKFQFETEELQILRTASNVSSVGN